jgi:poly(A) polymerase
MDPDALKVLNRLNRQGYTACLVGGAVRDLLLKRKPKDFDVGTTASPNQIKKIFRNSFLIGRRFRLAHIRFGTNVIECSTFRKQPEPVDATNDEESSLFMHHDNAYGTPKEDALRRDFTINGIFYDIHSFKIIDYVGGLKDIKNKIVRTIGEPDVRLCEDPVRMLRAIRFASRLGFTIERRTWSSMLRNHAEILKSSPARLYDEIPRLFVYGGGAGSIRLLNKSGLLKDLMPGICAYISKAKNKGKLFWRCLDALDVHNADEQAPSDALIYGAMCCPMYIEQCEKQSDGKKRINRLAIAQEVVTKMGSDMRMPRKTYFKLIHMFSSLHRFDGWESQRFSKEHFVRQESFKDAADLYELLLVAHDEEIPKSKPWLDLYNKSGGEACTIDDEKPRRRKRRRRRNVQS